MKPFALACFITGAHFDLAGRLDAEPVLHVSNPGRFVRQPGGAGLNAASTATALGLATTLAGPVGDDAEAQELKRLVAGRGIRDALVPLPGRRTGSYTSIMAPNGSMVIGLADLAINESVDSDWFTAHCGEALEVADCWFVSANLTEAALAGLTDKLEGRLLAAATVSPAKSVRLKPVLANIGLIFTNLAEARALTGLGGADGRQLAGSLHDAGVKAGMISAADGPLTWWDGETAGQVTPPPVAVVSDVNGAGDALAGAALAALARGRSMDEAAGLGIAAAQLTLSVPEPFYEGLDWEKLEEIAAEAC